MSSANLVTAIALSYVGARKNGNAHERALYHDILNAFNTVKPQGYTATDRDPWCAEAWSAWQIMAGNYTLPLSASCNTLISLAKKQGIWVEDESLTPQMGWGIFYDWDDTGKGDNKGSANHVGYIYDVDSKYIYVVEGNKGSQSVCGKRAVALNGRYIRGFIAPKYKSLEKAKYKPTTAYRGAMPTSGIHYTSTNAKALQEFLNWCINAGLEVDGQFGRASTDALITWQYTYGLKADGFFGDISLKMAKHIISEYGDKYKPVIKEPYKGAFPTLEKKVTDIQSELAKVGNELAYTDNTKKAKYPSGKPTEAYKKALAKLPASGHSWYPWARAGASCDVFTWTDICTAFNRLGLTPPPRAGLWYQIAWLEKSQYFKQVKSAQKGDIGCYRKKKAGKHGHIFLCYANLAELKPTTKGKVKEASAKQYYPKTTNSLRDRLDTDGKRWVKVFHAVKIVKGSALKRGCKGENVKNLQRFLNWYFKPIYHKDVLKRIDGDFGAITEKYLMLFQSEQKLVEDGLMGEKTLKAMKGVMR